MVRREEPKIKVFFHQAETEALQPLYNNKEDRTSGILTRPTSILEKSNSPSILSVTSDKGKGNQREGTPVYQTSGRPS